MGIYKTCDVITSCQEMVAVNVFSTSKSHVTCAVVSWALYVSCVARNEYAEARKNIISAMCVSVVVVRGESGAVHPSAGLAAGAGGLISAAAELGLARGKYSVNREISDCGRAVMSPGRSHLPRLYA